jgi:hypothetical protein
VIRRVFGVHSVSPTEERAQCSLDELVDAAEPFFQPHMAGEAFAVRARTAGSATSTTPSGSKPTTPTPSSSSPATPPAPPLALERLQYLPQNNAVRLASDKRDGPTAGTHDFPALEFLARLLAHVPDAHEVLVRHYGAYSVRRRARWRRAGILSHARPPHDISPVPGHPAPDWPALRARRQRWAELFKRIFEVDPLRCPRCGGVMQVIAFILDPEVIHALLRHLRRTGRDPRALPEQDAVIP